MNKSDIFGKNMLVFKDKNVSPYTSWSQIYFINLENTNGQKTVITVDKENYDKRPCYTEHRILKQLRRYYGDQ